jgi:predicted lipopolysaccharide heptosyltransferase III
MLVDPASVRSILVIKLRAIGDVLLSTVVLRNLKEVFPHARLDVLTERPSLPVVERQPVVDGVIVFDRGRQSGVELILRVRRGRYDLVIDLFGNPRTALLTRLSGARHRVGFPFRGRRYAYTIAVPPRGGSVHNTQFNLDALERLGVPIVDRSVRFPLADAERQAAERMVAGAGQGAGPLIALNAGGGWYTKRWPLEKFAELGDRLVAAYGARIVLPWGPGQLPEVEAVRGAMHHDALIPPATTLGELGALLQRMAMVITNDSGPMHIAAAVGTPVLAIFGPTNPALQGPYGSGHAVVRNESVPCLGCNLTQCPIHHPCMRELSVDTVFRSAEPLLSHQPRTA